MVTVDDTIRTGDIKMLHFAVFLKVPVLSKNLSKFLSKRESILIIVKNVANVTSSALKADQRIQSSLAIWTKISFCTLLYLC